MILSSSAGVNFDSNCCCLSDAPAVESSFVVAVVAIAYSHKTSAGLLSRFVLFFSIKSLTSKFVRLSDRQPGRRSSRRIGLRRELGKASPGQTVVSHRSLPRYHSQHSCVFCSLISSTCSRPSAGHLLRKEGDDERRAKSIDVMSSYLQQR